MWMNGQHHGQSKASSALPCTGTPKIMPPSFQSLHRLLFHYFGNDGFVSENLANSTSLLFVSTSVYSGAKFSSSKMKKVVMSSNNTIKHTVSKYKVLWAIL